QVARVGPVHDAHARIAAEFPGQLSVADIDGEYLFRAVLEQAIGEPAGGGAEVNGHGSFHFQLKVNQGVFQLVAAAADVFIPGLEFDPVVRADRVAGFVGGV